MNGYYSLLALELVRDREREAEMRNRRHLDSDGLGPTGPGVARRTLARAAASVSRGSAAIARRLDESITSDNSVRSSRLA
jgi:hypothetical protein